MTEFDIQLFAIAEQLTRIERKLDNRINKTWLSISDVIQTTGISRSTINRAIALGKLRSVKNIGKRMIRKEWVDKWINGKQRLSAKEKADFQEELLDVEIFNGAIRKALKDIEEIPVFPIAETTKRIERLEKQIELLIEERDKVSEEKLHE